MYHFCTVHHEACYIHIWEGKTNGNYNDIYVWWMKIWSSNNLSQNKRIYLHTAYCICEPSQTQETWFPRSGRINGI